MTIRSYCDRRLALRRASRGGDPRLSVFVLVGTRIDDHALMIVDSAITDRYLRETA